MKEKKKTLASKFCKVTPKFTFVCSGCSQTHKLSNGRLGKFDYEGPFAENTFWCKSCSDYFEFREL